MRLTSPSFGNSQRIPSRYTCDGNKTLSPRLFIEEIPSGTQSLALIVDDPDVPTALRPDGHFIHWVLFNIPPETREIPEGAHTHIGTSGANTSNSRGYTGPCPPPDYEPKTHRYIFTLYALDTKLSLSEGASKQDVEYALRGHVLAQAQLTGTYSRA